LSQNKDAIDPLVCPICGESNACVNLSTKDESKSCWCNDPSIKFPDELLAMVPVQAKRKACICKACVLKFHADKGIKL
jgi:hypothetical protein